MSDAAMHVTDLTGGRQFSEPVIAAQKTYTERHLKYVYNLVVHYAANHLAWRCPTSRLVSHYNQHVRAKHLDVGVGTGLLLDRCHFPEPPAIALMDLNEHALRSAGERVGRYGTPKLYRANVLEPIALEERFDSIGLTYLLHCLPGRLEDKGAALLHLRALLNPGGTIFGATILEDTFTKEFVPARTLSTWLRKEKILDNLHDDRASLESTLKRCFGNYTLEVVGAVALFSASASPQTPLG